MFTIWQRLIFIFEIFIERVDNYKKQSQTEYDANTWKRVGWPKYNWRLNKCKWTN
jgi:hypothetical protein